MCNGLKLTQMLAKNPYDEDIEACTCVKPDLPLGINMETVPAEDCTIHFHPINGMETNVALLMLEQRYEKYKPKAHKYLCIKQNYNQEKVRELVRAGFFRNEEEVYHILYEEPLDGENRPLLLQKLKRDTLNTII